jgi:hypothetical protein
MDNNFKLITNIINCNVGGFPKLKWNRVGSFNQIPITQNGFFKSKADYTITFFEQITKQRYTKQKYKYYYFVIWSSIFTHNTKRFLKQVTLNKKLDKNNEIRVTFINIDNEYQ